LVTSAKDRPTYDRQMRIVSLLPSATEIVYALGLDAQLVGVTFECDEPPAARLSKTIIVGGRDTSALNPAEIDSYVRETLSAGGDLYTLHEDALAQLDPDLILTQDLCRVCAVPTGQVREAVAHLGCSADVVTLDPYSLADVLDSIGTVADAAGVTDRAERLLATLRARLDTVSARVRTAGAARPRVAVIEWVDPVFGAGHWMPDMVEVAGGVPVACRPRQRSTAITWAEVRQARPDIVIVSPCGFGLAGAVQQTARVLPEVPGAQVWAVDGDGLMVRPGPRLVEGVETLAAVLHPGLFPAPEPGAATLVGRA
jgi:iron complex transport system substrate-binding protein